MADNVAITAGSGTNVAADDIGSVFYQRVKVTWGPDGTANDSDIATGKPLPVQLRSPTGTDMTGAAGTASAAVQTVQGITSMTPLLTTTTLAAGTANVGDVDVLTVPTDPFGANADAASATGSVSAKLRGIATALGVTALDLGASTAGSRTLRVALDTGQLGSLGQTTASASVSVTPASDRQNSEVYVLVMSGTTTILAAGEIIADTQQADAFFNKADGAGVINSLTIVDEAAQAAAINIVVMRTSTSLGTENSTANITDANLTAGVIGVIPVATTDWITISGASVACIQNIGLPVTAVTGTDDLYFAVLNGAGTPTYAGADDIVLKFGVLQD